MEKKTYLFQCLDGHVGEIPKGSELEDSAKNRESQGFVDAIILCADDCPDCQSEVNERRLHTLHSSLL